MLDYRHCDVQTAAQLDAEIRDIFALTMVQRGDEISGTLNVYYSDESVKRASLLPHLRGRGVYIAWHKKASAATAHAPMADTTSPAVPTTNKPVLPPGSVTD